MSEIHNLEYLKTVSDARGSIIFMKNWSKLLNFVEIKKGFSRGGHFHEFFSTHNLISGKVEYHEFNIKTNEERTDIYEAPFVIEVPPFVAHLLTAIEDVLFVETFDNEYQATEFPKYRKIVEEKLQKS
ncbi:MAG: hypothetical protein ACW9XA_04290 [Candidatus Nitrosopumilus sp. bin_6a]